MKTVIKVAAVCASVFLLASCVKSSKEYKQLQAENESLRTESVRSTTELNEMLAVLDEVENDIRTIRETENYLTIPQLGGEVSPTRQEEIRQNMHLITGIIQKNKQQISELEAKLKGNNSQFAALRKTIDRLNAEIEKNTVMITSLQADLAKKNVRIQELDDLVTDLNENVENLSLTAAVQSQKLTAQDKELHTAYYCFGTAKELKDQKILTGSGLFSKSKALPDGFNRDYFVAIDIREEKEIPLFSSKATLHSNHPEGTWRFAEDEDGNLTLVITNAEQFWSLSRFLVIQVKH
ncbi:hypothetical protein Barb6_01547 [Bacteroidales bacterium Barb6]|nr:hypothetical protein Barb6_01547 [Bacteroidales bacterium Barb6]